MTMFRFVLRSVGGLWSALMILLMVMSLSLSVAMTLVPAVFSAVAGVVGAATSALGIRTPTLVSPEVIYRGEKKTAGEAVRDTSQRMATRIKTAASKNVASTFGEAIPFIGVGVIVAATAVEVSDTCLLLKDVRELDAAFNPDNPIDPEEVCGMEVPSKEEIWARIKSAPRDVWKEMREIYADLPGWESVKDGLVGLGDGLRWQWDKWFGAEETESKEVP